MKVKKYIGKSINGFIIKDTYVKMTPNNKKTRKVLLECENCGRLLERCSSVDFEHIKCKCKCEYLKIPPREYHWIDWNGSRYTLTEFCKIHDINIGTFRSRIKSGEPVEAAIRNDIKKICPICDKEFVPKHRSKKYCSTTCGHRAAKKKGKYKQIKLFNCVVCGKEFESIRDDAKTCSKRCQNSYSLVARDQRYKHLKDINKFDGSVTLRNVFDKFDGICQCCGKKLNFDGNFQADDYPSIDHVIPISKGGTHQWDNVQLLCRRCNYIKKDNMPEV